jgi:hypothetical protein
VRLTQPEVFLSTSGVSLVLFEDEDLSFDHAHEALFDTGLTMIRQGERIAVWWENGPLVYISLAVGEAVRQQAEQIGQATPYAEILSRCSARFEITFDDLQAVREEMNTLLEVQDALQHVTQGFIFNVWNGQLAPPTSYEE